MKCIAGRDWNRALALDVGQHSAVEDGPWGSIFSKPFDASEHFGFDEPWFRFEHDDTLAAGQYPVDRRLVDRLDKAQMQHGDAAGQIEDLGDLPKCPVGRPDGDEADGRRVPWAGQCPMCIEFQPTRHSERTTGFCPPWRTRPSLTGRGFVTGRSVGPKLNGAAG